MDAAKAIAAEAAQEGWIRSQDRPGQPTEVPDRVLPIIALPTTAGTGSEVLPFAVITFPETRRKLVLNHEALYPRHALLDPVLLVSTPRDAQVAAGMDALTHAIESYVSREATAQSRERALAAIALITEHFRPAVADPQDLGAQAGMQRAAMVAGLGFGVSRLGIVHAMALPLSAQFGVPHGVANTILLPHGMDFNRPEVVADFANIAVAMGVCDEGQAPGLASERALDAVRQLADEVGAPRRMSEVGVQREAIPRMAEDAMSSPHIARNPRPVTLESIVALYERAY
jgi:alcohol dehydrogenase class IV